MQHRVVVSLGRRSLHSASWLMSLESNGPRHPEMCKADTAVVNLNSSFKKEKEKVLFIKKKSTSLHRLCKSEHRWNRKVGITKGSRLKQSRVCMSVGCTGSRVAYQCCGRRQKALESFLVRGRRACIGKRRGGPLDLPHERRGGPLGLPVCGAQVWGFRSGNAEACTLTRVCSRWVIG